MFFRIANFALQRHRSDFCFFSIVPDDKTLLQVLQSTVQSTNCRFIGMCIGGLGMVRAAMEAGFFENLRSKMSDGAGRRGKEPAKMLIWQQRPPLRPRHNEEIGGCWLRSTAV